VTFFINLNLCVLPVLHDSRSGTSKSDCSQQQFASHLWLLCQAW